MPNEDFFLGREKELKAKGGNPKVSDMISEKDSTLFCSEVSLHS